MALTKEDIDKIQDATAALDAAYTDYFARSDGYAKSSEGHVTITGGTWFQRSDPDKTEDLVIEVFSTAFARTGRRQRFLGDDAAQQFLDWARQALAEQLAREYDEHGDVIHRDAEGNVIDPWAGL